MIAKKELKQTGNLLNDPMFEATLDLN